MGRGGVSPFSVAVLVLAFHLGRSLAMGRGRKRRQAEMEDVGSSAGIVSYKALAEYNPEGMGAREASSKAMWRAYNVERCFELSKTTELYGKLFKTAQGLAFASGRGSAPNAAGTTPTVRYVDPFALLEYFCTISSCFAAFVERWCTGDEAKPRIIMYHDDVRPGNVHLPGYGRLYSAVYWTLSSFPDWFRTSDIGWFTLCVYPRKWVDSIKGGMSAFFTALLGVFYPVEIGTPNFERTGVRLPNGRGGVMRFKAPFGGLLADNKALDETMDTKGPSSKKPCARCVNLVGRCDESELTGTSLVHVTSAEYGRLLPQTPQGLADAWDEIHAAAGTMNADDFERLEMKRGVKHNPHGIQQSPLRVVAKFPRGALTDWMHDLVASGGVAQFEVGQFIRRMVASRRITFEVIQRFSDCISFPRSGMRRLSLEYHKRVKTTGKGKEKRKMQLADGSECIRVVMVLQAFAQRYLQPKGLFKKECECLFLLARIIRLLTSGDRVLGRLSLLLDLIKRHHEVYKELYPKCCIPKLHLLYHLADTFRYLCGNFSCFTPERKHRWGKRLCANANQHFHRTLLIRLTRMACKGVKRRASFEPIRFEAEPTALRDACFARLRALGVRAPRDVMRCCLKIRTPRGEMSVNDVVRIGSDEFGLVLSLFSIGEVVAGRAESSFFCEAQVFQRMTPLCYSGAEDAVSMRIVSVGCLKGAATYFKEGDVYHIVRSPVLAEED